MAQIYKNLCPEYLNLFFVLFLYKVLVICWHMGCIVKPVRANCICGKNIRQSMFVLFAKIVDLDFLEHLVFEPATSSVAIQPSFRRSLSEAQQQGF